MRAFATFLVVVMWVICSHAFARADVPAPPVGTPSADDMKEARRHFSVGNDLYKDGRFKEALLEFDAAYRLSARPAALLNVGDCQRQLNEYVDAYETYQAVLARHGAQLSAADRTAVQKAIEYLDGHTGLLAVAANAEGAEIVVDDRVLGHTPLAAPLRLDIGSHKLVVRKEGFVPFTPPADVQLLSKQLVKVDVTLVPEVVTGHLSVREENGRDVRVLVDDADKGTAPWEGDVAPGSHTVEAKGDRYASKKRRIELGKAQRLDLVLTSVPTTGRLRVAATPANATIEVDQREVGAGSWEGEVAAGPHHVEVALRDVRAARDVVVERGGIVVQEVPLPVDLQEQADERDRSEARRRLRLVVSLEGGAGIWNMDMGNIPAQVPVQDPSHTELNDSGVVAGGALSVRYNLAEVWALQARLNGQALIGTPNPQGLGLDYTQQHTQQQVSGTPMHFGLDLTGRWVPGRFFIGLGPSLHVWTANGSDTVTSGGKTYTIDFPVDWGIGHTFELGYLIGPREEWELLLRSQTAWVPHTMPGSGTLALGYALH